MKISLEDIDKEQFNVRPVDVAGETCFLVFPQHIGAKWNRANLIFRSSIWNSEGEPVSLSFKKFFNWGEQPDLAYTPFSLTANGGVQMMEKLDGSTLIASMYKGQEILRTRGTADAEMMENGYELALLKERYPLAFDFGGVETADYSLVYEWTSPHNQIVLKYSEPDIYLIAKISHKDYSLASQEELDKEAEVRGVKRPRRFKFDSFEDMFAAIHAMDYAETRKFQSPREMLQDNRLKDETEFSKNFEGFCIYCNRGQDIRKVKSAWYLAMHKLKSELSSFEKVVDLWVACEYPTYQEFYNHIAESVDFELAETARPDISRICGAKEEVDRITAHMKKFAEELKPLALQHGFQKGRKLQAEKIFKAYGDTNRAGFVFKILDGKDLTRDEIKKLMYQVLKK